MFRVEHINDLPRYVVLDPDTSDDAGSFGDGNRTYINVGRMLLQCWKSQGRSDNPVLIYHHSSLITQWLFAISPSSSPRLSWSSPWLSKNVRPVLATVSASLPYKRSHTHCILTSFAGHSWNWRTTRRVIWFPHYERQCHEPTYWWNDCTF